MNYESKYKEALSFLKDLKPHMSDYCIEKLEVFFPELKESEDERIKKMLIRIFKKADMGGEIFGEGITYKQVIAWLEKQGKQNHAEWQKQQMNETLQTEYEKGRYDMQQEMMKDAVELHIVESFNPVGTENEKPHGFTALCYNAKYPDFYPVTGQTIKVVPFKEIQQNEQDCRKKGFGGISSATRGI